MVRHLWGRLVGSRGRVMIAARSVRVLRALFGVCFEW
jgi:hypothetical protein